MRGAGTMPAVGKCWARPTNASAGAEYQGGPFKNTVLMNFCFRSVEWRRLRPLADFGLRFKLADGREGTLPCHRALFAQNSHVMRCVRDEGPGRTANGSAELCAWMNETNRDVTQKDYAINERGTCAAFPFKASQNESSDKAEI